MHLIPVKAPDGVELALWQVSANDGPAVIITHGTFSNRRSCLGLAKKLAEDGFAPWILEWRGHGESNDPDSAACLEDVADLDIPTALSAVKERHQGERIFFIGHSGGGLAMSMWMARNPTLAMQSISGLVLLAAQATHAARSRKHRALVGLIRLLLSATKSAPGHLLKIGPEPESSKLMRQWCDWNLGRNFKAHDGFDYARHLQQLEVPVLSLAGAGDLFIAPSEGCRELTTWFGGKQVQFANCGLDAGYSEDFSHDRLILSKAASTEIWPMISEWMKGWLPSVADATPIGSSTNQ